jgi:drug/metabolite transporter (DMT)-like permease
LVTLRFFFGLVGLAAYAVVRRIPLSLPSDPVSLGKYLFMGIVNTALPIALISWGELSIPSGLASILNATVPLFTLVVAHFWLHDEKITPVRAIGLIIGFFGVVVLIGPEFLAGGLHASLVGQLAVLVAALCYALGSTFSRRYLRGQSPFVQSVMVLLMADAVSCGWLLAFQRPVQMPHVPITWLAAAWLGILGSCVAYLLYFHLINTWGVTRTSMVTYVLPVFGVVLGMRYLHETLSWQLLVGLALILLAIATVSRPARRAG